MSLPAAILCCLAFMPFLGCAVENAPGTQPCAKPAAPPAVSPTLRKPVQWRQTDERPCLQLPENNIKPERPLKGRVMFHEDMAIPFLNRSGATRKWHYTAEGIGAKSAKAARQSVIEEYDDKFDRRDMQSYQRFVRHHTWRETKNPHNWRGPSHR